MANAFYRGRRDLVLLEIDPARLGAPLRHEAPVDPSTGEVDPASSDRFPHVYGAIELDAIVAASDVVPRADGTFAFDV